MTLPTELRNYIYELVFLELDGSERYAYPDSNKTQYRRGILRAAKRIRSEALPIYYGSYTFAIYISDFDPACFRKIAAWLRGVVQTCGRQPFREVTWKLADGAVTSYGGPIRHKILATRTLVEAIHESGTDLVSDGYRDRYGQLPENQYISRAGRLFAQQHPPIVSTRSCHYAALIRALDLAKRAHDNGWCSANLDDFFESFAISWTDMRFC